MQFQKWKPCLEVIVMHDLSKVEIWTGNQAIAEAAILSRPEVIAAYPITPSTPIIETLSKAVETGRLRAEFIPVESEHSAMAGVIGGATAGARVFTATSSQGLLYMMEMIYWAGYGRLPIVIGLVNRALAPGWSIWVDHQDAYSMRDAGWIQLFAKNNQEAYDLTIQAFKVAENHDVYMPAAVNIDGFVLSHVAGQVKPLDQRTVDDFLPPLNPIFKLDPKDPVSFGALTLPDDYKLLRQDLLDSMERAKTIITKVSQEWADLTGRNWGDLIEVYGEENADLAIVAMGTIAEEAEEAVDLLKSKGKSAAVLRIRSFRPFPSEKVAHLARNFGKLMVIDRGFSFGSQPPLVSEIRNSLYMNRVSVPVYSRPMGYGGKDVAFHEIAEVAEEVLMEEEEW